MGKLTGPIVVPEGYITHSMIQAHAAAANHAVRAAISVVPLVTNVPGIAGKVYTLIGVEINARQTSATAMPSGGLVELTNDAVDWLPCELIFNTATVLGATTGHSNNSTVIPLNKPLPAGSNVIIFYTARNATVDICCVTLYYSTKPYSGPQTFSNNVDSAGFAAVAAFPAAIAIPIPASKGGKCIGFLAQVYGTVVTTVPIGGPIVAHNTSAAYEPTMFCTGSATCIVSGGGEILVSKVECQNDCPGNSTFTFDCTTLSANAQVYSVSVVWEA